MIVWNWKYIQWEFVIESCRKQIHTGVIEHLEDRVRYRLIQSLFCFERPVQSRKTVCQYVEFAWDMTNSDHDIVFQAPMEDFFHTSTHMLGECVPPCIVGRDHDTRVVNVLYGFLQC